MFTYLAPNLEIITGWSMLTRTIVTLAISSRDNNANDFKAEATGLSRKLGTYLLLKDNSQVRAKV